MFIAPLKYLYCKRYKKGITVKELLSPPHHLT